LHRRWQIYALLLTATLVALAISPGGFVGGGGDDGRYLEAARCWADRGLCLPDNHWSGRWPVFAPVALLINLFGESRAVVQIWPFICGAGAVMLLAYVGDRLFGPRVGLAAGLLLLATPAYALRLMRPNVESVELCLILLAVICILNWKDRSSPVWAFGAGLAFGFAFQVRETAAISALMAFAAVLMTQRPIAKHVMIAAAGFALPLALELLLLGWVTGDPFYRRTLSMAHAQIYSSELASWVDRSRSPLFNADYIAGWRRDFHVHWLIDGPINLLLSVQAGFALLLAPILLVAGRSQLSPRTRHLCWWMLGLAAAYIALLTYALAMDPKPRVMIPAIAAASLALAAVSVELFERGRKLLVSVCWLAIAISSLLVMLVQLRPGLADRQARAWLAAHPGDIEADRKMQGMLTLTPGIRELPALGAGKHFAMVVATRGCRQWIRQGGVDPRALKIAGDRPLAFNPFIADAQPALCLLRYREPIDRATMQRASNISWSRRSAD
jgi:hypothetical protein